MIDKAVIISVGVFMAFFFFRFAKAAFAATKAKEYKKILICLCVVVFLAFSYWFVNSEYNTHRNDEPCASYDTRGCTE